MRFTRNRPATDSERLTKAQQKRSESHTLSQLGHRDAAELAHKEALALERMHAELQYQSRRDNGRQR